MSMTQFMGNLLPAAPRQVTDLYDLISTSSMLAAHELSQSGLDGCSDEQLRDLYFLHRYCWKPECSNPLHHETIMIVMAAARVIEKTQDEILCRGINRPVFYEPVWEVATI